MKTSSIEMLEGRIAPASVITFTDVDGDVITVKSTKGDLTGRLEFSDKELGQQLTEIDLASPIFQGTKLIIKAKKGATGDGLVNVGYINAEGVDLKRVVVPGDVGRIDAGDGNSISPAIRFFSAKSLGAYGSSTQLGGENGSGSGDGIDLDAIRDILVELVSTATSSVDGLLGVLQGTISDILNSGGLVDSTLQRLLVGLNSDIESLLQLGGESIHEVTTAVQGLLVNIASGINGLLEEGALHPGALPQTLLTLLQPVEEKVNDIVFPLTNPLSLGGTVNEALLRLEDTINGIVALLAGPIDTMIPEDLLTTLQDAIQSVSAGGLLGGLGQLLDDLLGQSGVLSALTANITATLTALQADSQLTNSISLLVEDLLALDAGITAALEATTDGSTQDLLNTVKSAIGNILALPQSLLHGLASKLDSALEGLLGGLSGTLPDGVDALVQSITSLIGDLGNRLGQLLSEGGELTSSLLRDLALLQTRLVSLLGSTGTELTEDVRTTVDTLISTILGILGTDPDTGGGSNTDVSLQSNILGDIRHFRIGRDVSNVFLNVVGSIHNVTIGGSLIGGSTANSGEIFTTGDIDHIRIGKHILGGLNLNSGLIQSDGAIETTRIGGSVIGGMGNSSGELIMNSDARLVKISGDLLGSQGFLSASIDSTNGRIRAVKIGGSIVSGSNDDSGSVRVMGDISRLSVRGSLIGDADQEVIISAAAAKVTNEETNPAFKRIHIGGRVAFASILGGYDTDLEAINSHAQIGRVFVKGDWIGSNLIAGAVSESLEIANFGTDGDARIDGGVSGTVLSKIAKVIIRGTVIGTPEETSDNYGFVAQHIAKFKFGKNKLQLSKGAGNDAVVISHGTGGDVAIHELAAAFPANGI